MNNKLEIESPKNLLWGNESKNHHYVFQAYLRRFSSDKKNKMIWASIGENGIKEVPIKSVAISDKMYETKFLNKSEISLFKLSIYILNRKNIDIQKKAEEFINTYNQPSTLNENVKKLCKILLENESYLKDTVFEKYINEFEENNKINLVNMNEKYYCEMESELNGFINDIIKFDFSIIKVNREKINIDLIHQYFRTKIMYERIKKVLTRVLENEQLCHAHDINRVEVDVNRILTPFFIFLPMICNESFYKSNISIIKNETDIDFITGDQPIINMCANYKTNEIAEKMKFYYPVSPKIALIINGDVDLQLEKINDMEYIKLLNGKMKDAHKEFLFANNEEVLKNII